MAKAKQWLLLLGAIYLIILISTVVVLGAPLSGAVLGSAVVCGIVVALIPVAFVIVLATVLIALPAVAFHELGHFVAGRLIGFRFQLAVVGPFGLRADKNRLVFFRMRPAPLGGYVMMIPADDQRFGSRFATFVAGGPIFSVLWLGLVFLFWSLSGLPIQSSMPTGLPIGTFVIFLLAQVSALIAIMLLISCLLPYRSRTGSTTDALRLIELARKDTRSVRLQAILSLQRLILAGVRVRDLPLETVLQAGQMQDGSLVEIYALQVRWAYELNCDPDASPRTLARIMELREKIPAAQMGEDWLSVLAHMQATDAIYLRYDAEAAEQFYQGATSTKPIALASRATVEAAIASVRNESTLPMKIEAARQAIGKVEETTTISFDWEREWLDAMAEGWPTKST